MDEATDGDRSGRTGRSLYAAVSVVGAAYFFAFVCYGGTDGLQTASNGGKDLPRAAVAAVICAASIVSSVLVAPAFVIRLSPSTALCVAWGSQALYAIASLYPTTATLVPTAVFVGATMPVVVVAQGAHITALVDRWCVRQGDEDGLRLGGRFRRPSLRCCCTKRSADDDMRRHNVFVMFSSFLMACVAAGSLCGSIVGTVLVGSAAAPQTHVTLTVPTARNCSLDSRDLAGLGCTRLDGDKLPNQGYVNSSSCGVNTCPYVHHPAIGPIRSSSSPWLALIFVLLCNVVGVVLTAFLPSFLQLGDIRRWTPSSTALPFVSWRQQSPLEDTQARVSTCGSRFVDGVGGGRAAVESMRNKTLTTLRLFTNRWLLLLAPTTVASGLTGSFVVAAFHQSFVGCAGGTSMIGHGTAYQRVAFIVTSLLTGQLTIHLVQRRTVVLGFLLAAVFTVASVFTWQHGLSDYDLTLIVVWCALNGAVAGVLRAGTYIIYPTLFGRGRFDSALLHANLWDSVGAVLAIVADQLCLVIRAWIVIFVSGAAAVAYAGLECACTCDCRETSDDTFSVGSGRLVASGEVNTGDRESLASACLSPTDTGSVATISSNHVRLQPLDNRAFFTYQPARHGLAG